MLIEIDAYAPEQHEGAVFELWQSALGKHWPLTRTLLRQVITEAPFYRAGDHFIVTENERVVGFVSTQLYRGEMLPQDRGQITALVVALDKQRQGIGTMLHNRALVHLREAGAKTAQLGGGLPRFWPGIPANRAETQGFFEKRGWQFADKSYDLAQNLHDYRTQEAVYEQMKRERLSIETGTQADMADILAFETREFPHWYDEYQYPANMGDYDDFLLVRRDGELVGVLIMLSPQSNPRRMDIAWKTVLGEDMGVLGAVGIAASEQGKGIGLAMIARGSEILRERGTGICCIGWTIVPGFYQRIGYTLWQEYTMSLRQLT